MKQGTHILSSSGERSLFLQAKEAGVWLIEKQGTQERRIRLSPIDQIALKELL